MSEPDPFAARRMDAIYRWLTARRSRHVACKDAPSVGWLPFLRIKYIRPGRCLAIAMFLPMFFSRPSDGQFVC